MVATMRKECASYHKVIDSTQIGQHLSVLIRVSQIMATHLSLSLSLSVLLLPTLAFMSPIRMSMSLPGTLSTTD